MGRPVTIKFKLCQVIQNKPCSHLPAWPPRLSDRRTPSCGHSPHRPTRRPCPPPRSPPPPWWQHWPLAGRPATPWTGRKSTWRPGRRTRRRSLWRSSRRRRWRCLRSSCRCRVRKVGDKTWFSQTDRSSSPSQYSAGSAGVSSARTSWISWEVGEAREAPEP